MTQTVADEVMLREPRLLVPGMQPLGPVKIDTTHPLGSLCKFATLPATNTVLTQKGIIRGVPAGQGTVYSAQGPGATWSANASRLLIPGGYLLAPNPYSVFVISAASAGAVKTFFSLRGGTNQFLFAANVNNAGNNTSGQLGLYVGTSLGIFSAGAIDGNRNSYAVTRQANSWSLYKNGIDLGAIGSDSLNDFSGSGTSALGNLANLDAAYYHPDGLYFVCGFNVRLTDSQIASLHADPYQFLIPA